MSVTRDKSTGKWMSQIRVKDWTGKEIHKKKRGFNTKKEAVQWERDFISQADGSLGMKFKDFVALYMKDADPRLRETTLANKRYLFDKKVLPYFGEMPINAIKPTDIRNWQNELIHYRRPNGKCYSPTYLRTINNQLTAAFNFAVKFYGLRENPCHKAGTMGKKNADEMLFWTNEEFKVFIEAMEERPVGYAIFTVMYYTGFRVGELLALTPEDIDFDRHIISVNKNYQRLNGKNYIYPPKTEAGYREVVMPKVLESCLKGYLAKLYDVQPTDRIFPYDRGWVGRQMKYGCDHSGTQKIRVHDVRHTHASLLIDMSCTPLLVAERLGHERVQTTMETYSHLYPNKQTEVAAQLDAIATKDDGYKKFS
ncbi:MULTISPECIES: site-specific integrase [Clostridium]|uniref:site-specific integrase n=1 Tax=Clostridium TaxID=1485 RepID=UPI000E472BB5|nr:MULTISPECIES: site-specific integrase [Clostridium]RHO12500.1 site-specific integrase [Clostridium sp. AM18-55]